MAGLKRKLLNIPLRNRIFSISILCGILPLILFSCISYMLSRKTILNNAMVNLFNDVKKNNEIIEIQLKRVEESALIFTVNSSLPEYLSYEEGMKQSEKLHRNLGIKRIMDQYFLGIPGVFSYHLYTKNYMMVGNYQDAVISNYKPPMYVPYEEFTDSEPYRYAVEARGQLVWIPTYCYDEMYGLTEYKKIQYDYPYLFSAVKQINCLLDESENNPILIVSYTPDFFENIFALSSPAATGEVMHYIVDQEEKIVYSKDKNMLTKKFSDLYDGVQIGKSGYSQCRIDGTEYILAYDTQSLTGWKQIVVTPSDTYTNVMRKVPQTLLFITLISSFALIVFLNFISKNITGPLRNVLKGMERLGEGEFMLRLPETEDHEMGILVKKFNEMDMQIHTLIVENYEIKLREKEAQLMALNLQMNPHFLYNTLNTINMMAISNQQMDISKALISLAAMLQRALRIKGDKCTVREDIENLRDYLNIMELRFEDAFSVEMKIDEEIMETHVPRLLLQPLVENSITHGFSEMEKKGDIQIQGWKIADGRRVFRVEDNGNGFVQNTEEGHVGLSNLRNRLHLMYGEDYFMNIVSKLEVGTVVTIVLPSE